MMQYNDDFCNSEEKMIERLRKLNRRNPNTLTWYEKEEITKIERALDIIRVEREMEEEDKKNEKTPS